MRDIMCTGYVAGGNTNFFGEAEAAAAGGNVDGQMARNAINSRLSMDNEASGEYESMMAFIVPKKDLEKGRDQVISISQRVLPWEVNATAGAQKTYFPGGDAGWNAYKDVYGLEGIHYGEDVRASENQAFITSGSANNSTCFVGPHRKYNPLGAQFFELVPGQGHMGPDAIPGDARYAF
jgi:hypothetical protein